METLKNYRILRAALRCPQANPQLAAKLELIDAVLDAMRPDYSQLLRLTYIEPYKDRFRLLEQLAISESTYYRRRAAALRCFASAIAGYF